MARVCLHRRLVCGLYAARSSCGLSSRCKRDPVSRDTTSLIHRLKAASDTLATAGEACKMSKLVSFMGHSI